MKRVVLLPRAVKALRKHRVEAERILTKIEAYAADPAGLANNLKALQPSTARRLRVGDYRVVFEETNDEIIVTQIGPRGSVYD